MAKSRHTVAVVILALAEIGLLAALVAVALGARLATISGWVEQIPGGRLAAGGGAAALLFVAAIAMTILVSD
jgi:Flp pilus assembly pilin Flp